ncbi:MAG: nickel-type superoxide dismutase maturation protease [Moorea sp. SIO2B7]|nr:nickel-type superoxide dismutase maturation protease [Moorena sp. SIO2B7]
MNQSSYQELLLWLLRKRRRFRVTGVSMSPLLEPGDEILVDLRAYQQQLPCIGDLVVANHPYRQDFQLVKRVVLVFEDGSCFLKGDNSLESTDSRSFGTVTLDQILGRVTSRLP